MSSSVFVGRVGGLAVALGVGAAVFSGGGVAWAGPDSSAASGSSAGDGSDSGPVRKALKAARAGTAPTPRGVRDGLKNLADSVAERAAAAAGESKAVSGAPKVASSSKRSRVVGGSSDSSSVGVRRGVGVLDTVVAKAPDAVTSLPRLRDVVPQMAGPAVTLSSAPIVQSFLGASGATGAVSAAHDVPSVVATVASRLLSPFAGNSPGVPPVNRRLRWCRLLRCVGDYRVPASASTRRALPRRVRPWSSTATAWCPAPWKS